MLTWIRGHETLFWWLGALSIGMFVSTLVILPIIVARLPVDYFTRDQHHSRGAHTGDNAAPAGSHWEESPRSSAPPGRCGYVSAPGAGDSDDPDWPHADELSGEAHPRAAPGAAALGMASHKLDTGASASATLGDAGVFCPSLKERGDVRTWGGAVLPSMHARVSVSR